MKPKFMIQKWIEVVRFRYDGIRLEPMDRVVIGYLAVTAALLFPFHRQVSEWAVHVLVHITVIGLILELIRVSNRNGRTWLDFLRTFYPVIGFSFAWKEVGRLVNMIFPFWGSELIAGWDLRLFGVHPTVWVERLFRPWLTELMNFFYSIYYLMLSS